MLPLYVSMEGRKAVVFGGGPVALRKARFLSSEMRVIVISRDFRPEIRELPVELIEGEAMENLHLIDGAFLVVAATGDKKVNDAIASKVKGMALINRDDQPGTFLIPSFIKGDGFMLAISTGGRSPAFSRYIRLRLESMLGEEWGRMLQLQEGLREEAKRSLPTQGEREEFLRSVLEDRDIWDSLRSDPEGARAMAMARLEERL